MRTTLLLLVLGLTLAGCVDPYESENVECDATTNRSAIDDGATSPLRCERTDDSVNGTGTASSGDRSSSPR